jgi:hypothetical protein
MHLKYSGHTVSRLSFLPLLFLPVLLTAQTGQDIPLKNWAAPLYWQPNQAEREAAANAGQGIRPMVTQLSASPLTFVAISPCRMVDTRGTAADFNGVTPFSGPSLGPSTTTTFPVQSTAEAADTTPTPCGTIPSIAQAYSLNITAIPKTSGGIAFVTIWPAGSPQPGVSTLNDGEGAILANAAIVPAGTPNGGINVLNSGPATMDVTIDMNGYYAASGDITSVAAGTDLTESGTGGAVTLNLNTNLVPTLAGTNNFTGPGNFFTGGSVGIGTTTPAVTLEVNGPAQVDGNISLNGYIIDGGLIVYQQPSCGSPANNVAVGPGAYAGSSCGTGNTSTGYCAAGNGGGSCSSVSAARPVHRAPEAQDTGNNLHPETSGPSGSYNASHGYAALSSLSSGYYNTAMGAAALFSNTTGSNNTAIGGYSLEENVTGANNIAIGYNAGLKVSTSNNIHIGTEGASADSGVIRIGGNTTLGDPATQTAFFAAGIRGITTGNNNAAPVMIDSNGQLGTISSSRRFKEDIEDMGEASRDLMRLRPVTFRYKKPFADGSKPIQYGLIAEEVDEVYPDLVAHSADGQIETVKYQVLDSMLLNEVQRQQAEIGAQKEQLQELEQRLSAQDKQIGAQRQQNVSLQERLDKLEALMGGTSRPSGAAAIR